ncbi:hypothetical protein GCM10009630_36950 [Kribbella jejuensis]|uniref:DUF11 domain-containing protein n=1 Tax=Kribbella jejuensis TaxID=236068 RepID=A0A542ESL8_9ACTN|nr:hypothetical protein [Kribbella jejuensis]TQJ18353.1 hypothetical protein FB475_2488 [Kribbella jejuensis]
MTHQAPAMGCCGPVATDAPIAVTINPEARVNVARSGAPVGTLTTGEWHTIPVTVVNDGFVTGPLVVEAEPVPGLELDAAANELTGEHRQDAAFRVRLDEPTMVDVTLTFRALGALGGLANHSTVNLLLSSMR